jgi:predicted site-specific integrase-resolvase
MERAILMMTDTPTPLMDEIEAANILHVSISSLRRWRRLGNGPMFRKFGRTVRYRPADLSDFVASAGRVKTVGI